MDREDREGISTVLLGLLWCFFPTPGWGAANSATMTVFCPHTPPHTHPPFPSECGNKCQGSQRCANATIVHMTPGILLGLQICDFTIMGPQLKSRVLMFVGEEKKKHTYAMFRLDDSVNYNIILIGLVKKGF